MGGMLLCPPLPRTVTSHVVSPFSAVPTTAMGCRAGGCRRRSWGPETVGTPSWRRRSAVWLGQCRHMGSQWQQLEPSTCRLKDAAGQARRPGAEAEEPAATALAAAGGRTASVSLSPPTVALAVSANTAPPSSNTSSSSAPRERSSAAMAAAPAGQGRSGGARAGAALLDHAAAGGAAAGRAASRPALTNPCARCSLGAWSDALTVPAPHLLVMAISQVDGAPGAVALAQQQRHRLQLCTGGGGESMGASAG